ncbi:SIR2 family protein [Mesorhizobium sp. AR07]|uniref:SIR2 family protein n=1 Tax=Mesorhizobium sp. AR07 TaxID=2865838 RepID=UPI002160ABFC|nr:SIR2 family protein [Mesorhizobium sp. AR07]UVK46685.1 SIR2 family protein [Mesorhizobium sp. AR07]
MTPPSNLPSARRVAEMCFDEYRLTADPNCDIALRENLEGLAEHFVGMNTLESVFIERIVPWKAFTRPSNPGHAAIADFLITRAFTAGISTNYDTLIERSAWDNGFDFRGSLDGDEANIQAAKQGPLLKFHGCALQDRLFTVWAPSQLAEPKIAARIEKSKTWMAANLRQRDLLVVGFWSDWTYLNAVIGSALKDVAPLSVTVVDLSDAQQLEQKAPDLWALAHGNNVTFEHLRESGADVLDELRRAFSRNFLRQMLNAGRAAFEDDIGGQGDPNWFEVSDQNSETLYGWRRDAEGVPAGEPAAQLHPINCEVLGYFHLLLRRAGAQEHPNGYELNGRTIRVLNGAGALLSKIQSRFVEAPPLPAADVVVAVGATDLGVPANVVRRGQVGSVVRPAAGGAWLDTTRARAELNV